MIIYIQKPHRGWWDTEIFYKDDYGNISESRFYLYYSKREALSRFKKEMGLRYKRDIQIVELGI